MKAASTPACDTVGGAGVKWFCRSVQTDTREPALSPPSTAALPECRVPSDAVQRTVASTRPPVVPSARALWGTSDTSVAVTAWRSARRCAALWAETCAPSTPATGPTRAMTSQTISRIHASSTSSRRRNGLRRQRHRDRRMVLFPRIVTTSSCRLQPHAVAPRATGALRAPPAFFMGRPAVIVRSAPEDVCGASTRGRPPRRSPVDARRGPTAPFCQVTAVLMGDRPRSSPSCAREEGRSAPRRDPQPSSEDGADA